MTGLVKICGIADETALAAALDAGADMIGLVRFSRSPRHVGLDDGGRLSRLAQGRSLRVLLTVDAPDDELDESVAALEPDMLQLHGREDGRRLAALRARYGRPVLKAVGVRSAADLDAVAAAARAADRVLVDAAAPPDGLPGGNGLSFDWRLAARRLPAGALLAGGLTPDNVGQAIRSVRPDGVDVSSGVETRPGLKDPGRIAAFVAAARRAFSDLERAAGASDGRPQVRTDREARSGAGVTA